MSTDRLPFHAGRQRLASNLAGVVAVASLTVAGAAAFGQTAVDPQRLAQLRVEHATAAKTVVWRSCDTSPRVRSRAGVVGFAGPVWGKEG